MGALARSSPSRKPEQRLANVKVLVLGAGMQGTACAHDLVHEEGLSVTIADRSTSQLARARDSIDSDTLELCELDLADETRLGDLLENHDACVSAAPYFLNLRLTEQAISAGTHFTDMGGNTDLVRRQLQLSDAARARGVSVCPDMGLAPGMANLLAVHAMQDFEQVRAIHIRVGGLPIHPKPPLDYMMLFSMHGLINEYFGNAIVLRDYEVREEPCFSTVESLHVEGLGELEAFPTLGGISTLPYTYAGKVETMDYRTIRYKGHYDRVKCMIELGLLDPDPIEVDGQRVVPRNVFAACAEPKLTHEGEPDLTIVRVEVRGIREGKSARSPRTWWKPVTKAPGTAR